MANFVIRSVREEDIDELYRLSKLVYFLNLPADKEILQKKIQTSINSFSAKIEDKFAREYILVLEDLDHKKLVGSSMIIAKHGDPKSPHMYFELKELKKYSETIHTGFIHKVLRLKFDYDGPTEIGGLVIDPKYRGHAKKLGRQLSFARFLFIKMRRRWFKDRILSELMPPLKKSGESVLWEALGRRFTNLSYQEADKLSRKNKEFVTSLFPKRDIFVCLLSPEARDAIGKVGKATEPVKHMLEKIGFRWTHHIDPFDGGPHFWAETDKVSLVHDTKKLSLHPTPSEAAEGKALCGVLIDENEFFCVQTPFEIVRGTLHLPKKALETLKLESKTKATLLPL